MKKGLIRKVSLITIISFVFFVLFSISSFAYSHHFRARRIVISPKSLTLHKISIKRFSIRRLNIRRTFARRNIRRFNIRKVNIRRFSLSRVKRYSHIRRFTPKKLFSSLNRKPKYFNPTFSSVKSATYRKPTIKVSAPYSYNYKVYDQNKEIEKYYVKYAKNSIDVNLKSKVQDLYAYQLLKDIDVAMR